MLFGLRSKKRSQKRCVCELSHANVWITANEHEYGLGRHERPRQLGLLR